MNKFSYYLVRVMVLCLFLIGTSGLVMAQSTISGTVTDGSTGESLAGVNIFDINAGTGTVTDVNGEYSITVTGSTTLRFSFIGFVNREIEVNQNTGTLDVELRPDVANLDEVVITGLASTIKRANLANAVSSIKSEDIADKVDPQTLDNAMQGKIPGVQITSLTGAPGGGFNVQLRGVSTLGAGGSQPLFIIDGVFVDNSTFTTGRSTASGAGGTAQDNSANRLADLNPDDVESIEVLKGASAAAIYGQRANAGVIIIKTKQGKAGETQISFSQDIGFNDAVKFLGRTNWTEARIDLFWGTGTSRAELEKQRLRNAQAAGNIIDLEREIYGNHGTINNTKLSFSGGNEKTRFYVSGSFNNEDGIIKNTGFDRKSLRANLDHDVNSRIRVSSKSNFIETNSDRGFTGNQNNTGGSVGYSLAFHPNYAFNLLQQNPDGSFPDTDYFAENPFRLIEEATNNQRVRRYVQSFNFDADLYEMGSLDLNVTGEAGFDFLSVSSIVHFPEFMQFQRSASFPGDVIHTNQEAINTNLRAFLIANYSANTGIGNIDFSTQIGATRFSRERAQDRTRGQGLLPGQININNASQINSSQFFSEVTDLGFVAQQEANYSDRVILTVGARYDRSTLNLDQDQFYFYPKASVAVNLTNFDFWNIDLFNQFKLRSAYGETGGLPGFGQTFTALGNTQIGPLGGASAPRAGVDPNLDPERAKELEFGIDFSVLDGKISFEGTYYNKRIEDLILPLNPSPATGVFSVLTNAAELENKGFELGLTASPVRNQKFSWTSRVLWWTNDSEVTKLIIPEQENSLLAFIGFGATLFKEGVSPTAIFGLPRLSDGDLTRYGDFQPDFQMSWSNDFTIYKNFDLGFLWHWSKGGENVNLSTLLTDSSGNTADFFDDNNNLTERLDQGFSTTDRWVEDASFFKLREASLYYTIPGDFLENAFGNTIRRIRLGVSGTNLLILSDYNGYDPEVNFEGRTAIAQSVSITPFPTSRKILFHFNLDL